jgi:hypothetical protein
MLKLTVYSPMGKVVAELYDGPCAPGSYNLPFTARELAAGIYFYQMSFTGTDGTKIISKKMIVK